MADEKKKAPAKGKRKPQKATQPPKGKTYKRFLDDDGKYYWKYV